MGTNLWAAFGTITPDTTTGATQDYAPEITTATGTTQARLNCFLRHWYVLKTMLACAKTGLSNLMNVDSGCLAADVKANRYGCLCRRRARYLVVTSVAAPTVAGTELAEVVVETLKGEVAAPVEDNITFDKEDKKGYDY